MILQEGGLRKSVTSADFWKTIRCILVRESNFYTDKSALLCHALLNSTLQFYSTLSLTKEGERNVKLKNAVKR